MVGGDHLLMGRAMLSKSLIQFSLGWGCVPSLLFDLRNMVEVMKIMATFFKSSRAHTATRSAPDPAAGHRQPTPPPETPGHSQASLGESLVGSLLLSPGSWCTQGSVCALQESVSPVLWQFCNQIPLVFKVKSLVVLNPFTDPQVGKFVLGSRTLTTVGELLWYNCSAICGSSVNGSIVGLMVTSSKRIYATL